MNRFTIQFYGGWYVIDNRARVSGEGDARVVYNETASVTTRDQALRLAEYHNRTGDRLPLAPVIKTPAPAPWNAL